MNTTTSRTHEGGFMIREVRAYYALNVGERVNLQKCRALLEGKADSSGFTLAQQQSVRFRSGLHPLSVVECEAKITELNIGRWSLHNTARLTLYELGLCSVEFRIETESKLEDLVDLSTELWQNVQLAEQARMMTARLLQIVDSAVFNQELSQEPEDYIVYLSSPEWDGKEEGLDWLKRNSSAVARVLNSEPGTLSSQECEIALSGRVAYSNRDLAVLDWAAALVLAEDQKLASDVLEVIEFANAILLNLRELDMQLHTITDQLADELTETLGAKLLRQLFGDVGKFLDVHRTHWRFRRVLNRLDNPLDLVGDTHLERIYRELASGLRVKSYRSSIESSLASLGDYRDRLKEESRHIISRNLELIIVALFLYEVFLK